jgi:hypothetical protein
VRLDVGQIGFDGVSQQVLRWVSVLHNQPIGGRRQFGHFAVALEERLFRTFGWYGIRGAGRARDA